MGGSLGISRQPMNESCNAIEFRYRVVPTIRGPRSEKENPVEEEIDEEWRILDERVERDKEREI